MSGSGMTPDYYFRGDRLADSLFRNNAASIDNREQVARTFLRPLHHRVILHDGDQLRSDVAQLERLPVPGHALQRLQLGVQTEAPMLVLDLQPPARLKSCSDTLHLSRKPLDLRVFAVVVSAAAVTVRALISQLFLAGEGHVRIAALARDGEKLFCTSGSKDARRRRRR